MNLNNHWPLLPILVLATLLRLWQINESLWLDELHSAWVVSSGVGEIVERAQIGNQSPLYFYLPWLTTSLFGMSEWALRLPSLLAGVGLVAIAYGMIYQWTRSIIAASACAVLVATDHNFLFYATEARPYACVQLIAAIQLAIFWKLQSDTRVRVRAAFVVASVLLCYLHYTAILLLAGEILLAAIRSVNLYRRREGSTYLIDKMAIDLVVFALLVAPLGLHVLDVGARRGNWASFINNISIYLPVRWFSLDVYVAVPIIVCSLFATIWLCRQPKKAKELESGGKVEAGSVSLCGLSRRGVTASAMLFCWLGIPLAIVWLLTVTDAARLYLGRYVVGAALAPVLFAGLCVAFFESRKHQTIVASIIIAFAVGNSGMIGQLRYDSRLFGDRVENWRDAVRFVNDNHIFRDPVFVRSGLLEADRLATDNSELLRRYCVLPVTSIYQVERSVDDIRPLPTSNSGSLSSEDMQRVEQSGAAWFIINGNVATCEHVRERILESLAKDDQSAVVLNEQRFGNVEALLIILFEVDDRVEWLDPQPTSPNSNASP
jgi:Dolichyl-phosphate-mannose-protein mannosyltransferase